jgi:cell division protein FtsB
MPKKKQTKNTAEKTNTEEKQTKSAPKKSNILKKKSSLPGWIAAGCLLLLLVGLFIYAQNSISQVKEEKKEIEVQTKVLKSTVNTLQQQVSSLNQKTEDLEESARKSNEYLFAENISKRKLPDSVETKDWKVYKDEVWLMTITYPQTWQISQSAVSETQSAQTDQKAESRKDISLEPVGHSEFIRAMQIMPYNFGKDMSMEEKLKTFENKSVLDAQDFNGGKLVYFIEQADQMVIPTVMILSDRGDYKAIFRVNDLFNANYFDFLTDFEKMLAVVKVEPKSATAESEQEPQPAEEPKEE